MVGVWLGPGTLYRTIARLVADEVAIESETRDRAPRMTPVAATTSHRARRASRTRGGRAASPHGRRRRRGRLDPQRRTA